MQTRGASSPADGRPAEPEIPSARRAGAGAGAGLARWQSACAAALRTTLGGLREAATEPHPRKSSEAVDPSSRPAPATGYADALRQVDATLYELEQLRRELESVIDPSVLAAARASALPAAPGPRQQGPSEPGITATPAQAARSAA